MAGKSKAKEVVYLISTAETGHFYTTMKNKKTMTGKMEKRKYDPIARKHVLYKEGKVRTLKKNS